MVTMVTTVSCSAHVFNINLIEGEKNQLNNPVNKMLELIKPGLENLVFNLVKTKAIELDKL